MSSQFFSSEKKNKHHFQTLRQVYGILSNYKFLLILQLIQIDMQLSFLKWTTGSVRVNTQQRKLLPN